MRESAIRASRILQVETARVETQKVQVQVDPVLHEATCFVNWIGIGSRSDVSNK